MRRRLCIALALCVALLGAASTAQAATVRAERLLGDLRVAVPQSAGYDRDLFDHWIDADGDGCDTRDEVLLAEATSPPGVTGRCTIAGGRWWSAYDDLLITSASRLDIDHFVPLAEAWRSGARRWSAATRRAFANDLDYPLSLIAVSASSNRSKSDQDPALWMPSFDRYRCTYAASWIAVKWRWRLTVDGAERLALRASLLGCGSLSRVPRPTRASIALGPTLPAAPAAATGAGGRDPQFGSCREAIAAGFGPYVKGVDVEYDWYRDGDGDGTVCE